MFPLMAIVSAGMLLQVPFTTSVCQLDLFTAFGICSVIVNEDTPNDAELWRVGVAGGYW